MSSSRWPTPTARPSSPAPPSCFPSRCSFPIAKALASSRTCGWTRARPPPLPEPWTARPPPPGRSSTPANTSAGSSAPFRCCPIFIPSSTSLQALRHRPGRPARSAHSRRALRRRDCRPRPYSRLGWRHLLGRPAPRAKTPAEQASTNSLALFYLSAWKNAASAQAFAQLYADSLGRKYSGLKPDLEAQRANPANLVPARPGAGLLHQRRPRRHHHPRQTGLRR